MKYSEWRGEKVSQFVLGAAQLGMNYGIANQTGQPDKKEAFSILDEAIKNGVTTIDTAQAYGNSEEIIGQWLEQNNNKEHHIHIISKWDTNVDIKNKEQLNSAAQTSAKNLGVPLWGMMIHDEMHLNQLDVILSASKELKKEGVFKYLGASVYSVEAAKKAIMNPDIDFIQVPCNAWDQRMVDGGVFELAKKNNTLCFVRSIFLQGVLTMNKEEISNKLPKLSHACEIWEVASNRYKVSKRKLAIEFAKQLNCPLVLGIERQNQVSNNIHLSKTDLSNINFKQINKDVNMGSLNFDLDPRNWDVGK
jgi:aryl-alcohol dehydrogenase-like predicted oxidoreductase